METWKHKFLRFDEQTHRNNEILINYGIFATDNLTNEQGILYWPFFQNVQRFKLFRLRGDCW